MEYSNDYEDEGLDFTLMVLATSLSQNTQTRNSKKLMSREPETEQLGKEIVLFQIFQHLQFVITIHFKGERRQHTETVQYVIRHYQASDKEFIVPLYRLAMKEFIYSAFKMAMRRPDSLCVTLSMCVMGYILGGSSSTCALLAGGAWVGLVYHCCHVMYNGHMRKTISSRLSDIISFVHEWPDARFWLAEAELTGGLQIVGMVAVVGKSDGGGEADWRDGGVAKERRADLRHLMVAPLCRKNGLGSQLMQRALHFCRERSFSRVVVETSSPQKGAIALYRKQGFMHTLTHSSPESSRWVNTLSGITVLRLEMELN